MRRRVVGNGVGRDREDRNVPGLPLLLGDGVPCVGARRAVADYLKSLPGSKNL